MSRVVRTSLNERDYALITQLMPTIAKGWETADDLTLQHEAERLEGQQASPVVRTLRAILDAERCTRSARKAGA